MTSFTLDQVRGRRLLRSGLVRAAPPEDDLAGLVGRVGGLQAQVLAAAELGIGMRAPDTTREDVAAALYEERSIVKTYGPRGTLHLLPAAELPLWMAALREVYRIRLDDLDEQTRAVGDALAGRTLGREELADAVGLRLGPAARKTLSSTWGIGLYRAALAGCLCFAESDGAKVRFARADEWIGGWDEPDGPEALRELARCHVRVYGPCGPESLARWLLLKADATRALFDSLAGELEEVDVEGRPAFVLAGDAEGDREPRPDEVALVPQYDVYLLNQWPRNAVLTEADRARAATVGRGRFEGAVALNLLLVGGRVAGIWTRKNRGRRVEIVVSAFARPTKAVRAGVEAEAARVGRFPGRETDLDLTRLQT